MVKRSRTYKKSRKQSRKSGRKQRKTRRRLYKKGGQLPTTPPPTIINTRNPPPAPIGRNNGARNNGPRRGARPLVLHSTESPVSAANVNNSNITGPNTGPGVARRLQF